VIAAFDDGILWVTLGQTPNLVRELTGLYGALTGEAAKFVSVEFAVVELSKSWKSRIADRYRRRLGCSASLDLPAWWSRDARDSSPHGCERSCEQSASTWMR
jgi:hypothetical protein